MYDLPSFAFPDRSILNEELSDKLLFISKDTKEKEIKKTVVELAAARFANSTKKMYDVTKGIENIIYDLLVGKDSFTRKSLTNFGESYLPFSFWEKLGQETQKILLENARKV